MVNVLFWQTWRLLIWESRKALPREKLVKLSEFLVTRAAAGETVVSNAFPGKFAGNRTAVNCNTLSAVTGPCSCSACRVSAASTDAVSCACADAFATEMLLAPVSALERRKHELASNRRCFSKFARDGSLNPCASHTDAASAETVPVSCVTADDEPDTMKKK